MDFGFTEDQLALRDAVRAFCREHADLARVAGREGKPAAAASWSALAELGVLGVLVPEDAGGAGLGPVEAALAFEEFGIHLVSGPVLWSTIMAPLVSDVASGAARVTGSEVAATAGPKVLPHADEADLIVQLHADRVTVGPRSELPAPLAGAPLDPLTPTAVFPSLPDGEVIGDAAMADRLRLLGTVLSAGMLVGAAAGALHVARSYALEREQFGVPIGSFQAIKHLLADMYVRLELARAEVYAAAATVADPSIGDQHRAVSAAKLLAGDAGMLNARSAVQILGGMGFTWDMLPHYYLKRTWVLENTFGTAKDHSLRLSAAIETELADA
jgi:alkylation response protein AidB-like acyl-CoA dehydrogenase